MSTHTEILRELIAPTFRLVQPNGADREGLAGARAMVDALGQHVREILALVEQDDHVAVRWQVTGMSGGAASAMMAMYRFEAGRIVDDCGIAVAAPWPQWRHCRHRTTRWCSRGGCSTI